MTDKSRLIAYEAVRTFLQEGRYLSDLLPENDAFAREISYGTVRKLATLEYLARHLTPQKKLKLSLKEKALLFTALYQITFMDRTPAYAAVDETIKIAKSLFHKITVEFMNALLRKASVALAVLPLKKDPEALSIYHSYPVFFIQELLKKYSFQECLQILKSGNQPSTTMARKRSDHSIVNVPDLQNIKSSPEYYIQNRTPVELMRHLKEKTPSPQTILDVCAAPGGKLLLAHDFYPKARLWANDSSLERTVRLKENLLKYSVEATLTNELGEKLALEPIFDLIILDVPCSNSGVLNKRPEARWRLSNENLTALNTEQKLLLAHAKDLLSPGGAIWYLTCSVLDKENEEIISYAKTLGLKPLSVHKILPDLSSSDGGFACLLKKS